MKRSDKRKELEPCIHHWIIPNNGIIVTGTCAKCGASRQFDNEYGTAIKKR